MELLGRGMQIHAFSYKKLLKLARENGGNERGLLIISPDETVITQAKSNQPTLFIYATLL